MANVYAIQERLEAEQEAMGGFRLQQPYQLVADQAIQVGFIVFQGEVFLVQIGNLGQEDLEGNVDFADNRDIRILRNELGAEEVVPQSYLGSIRNAAFNAMGAARDFVLNHRGAIGAAAALYTAYALRANLGLS